MKKFFKVLMVLLFVIAMSACGSSSQKSSTQSAKKTKEYVKEKDFSKVYANPNKYKGKWIKITGRVFNKQESEDGISAFQMWGDVENSDWNTLVYYNEDNTSVSEDDYVTVDGEITGKYKGENLIGSSMTALMIEAKTLSVKSATDVLYPTLKTVTPQGSAQDQSGAVVTINKIEFAETETRIYITVTNNSGADLSLYASSAKIVQGANQYDYQYNYDVDYPEISDDITNGVTISGVITFPAIDQSSFRLIIDAYSDNYDLNIDEYDINVNF